MSTFIGWLNSPIDNNALSALTKYSSANESHIEQVTHINENNFSLFSCQTYDTIFFANQQNHFAIVIGTLSFSDKDLASIADDRNIAFALIEGYLKYSDKIFNKLSGHYSFVIVNASDMSAILATDRFCTQPIFYSKTNDGGLVFSSSCDDISKHPNVDSSANLQSIFNYTYFHAIPSPNTIYKGINKLEPGQYLVRTKNNYNLEYHWNPEFTNSNAGLSIDALADNLKELLYSSVQRCHPTTDTGSFLSGGLDSSTVSGFLSKAQNSKTKTFSIGFDQQGYDEIEYARIAAKRYNTELNTYYVTPDDIKELLPLLASSYDEPFGNSSAIPTYYCAKLAKENGTNTLLAGDGGDEIFAGNARYAKQKVFDLYTKVPKWQREHIVNPLFSRNSLFSGLPLLRKISSYIEQASIKMPERMESYNFLHRTDLSTIFTTSFLAEIDTNNPIHLLSDTYSQAESGDLLNRMLFLDWKFTLADNDIRKVNRMCEAAGIKVCYPMLDDKLVDFSTQIPSNLKLKGLKLRYFYKYALNDFLPHEIINKPKQGFGLPFGEWLKKSNSLQEYIYSLLNSLMQRDIFKETFIKDLIREHKQGHAAYYGTMVWVLAVLELWMQKHRFNL